jgi:PPOX class probable F420-dependent enzyme
VWQRSTEAGSPYCQRMSLLTADVRAVLESGRLAHLATLNPDGSPQISAVWVGVEGDEIVTGHMMGGQKVRNIARDPRVALTVESEGANSLQMADYLMVKGTARLVVGGAPELLQRLAEVYIGPGVRFPPFDSPPPGHVIRITPTRIGGSGPWAVVR